MKLKNYLFFLCGSCIFFAMNGGLSRRDQLRKTFLEQQKIREDIAKKEAIAKRQQAQEKAKQLSTEQNTQKQIQTRKEEQPQARKSPRELLLEEEQQKEQKGDKGEVEVTIVGTGKPRILRQKTIVGTGVPQVILEEVEKPQKIRISKQKLDKMIETGEPLTIVSTGKPRIVKVKKIIVGTGEPQVVLEEITEKPQKIRITKQEQGEQNLQFAIGGTGEPRFVRCKIIGGTVNPQIIQKEVGKRLKTKMLEQDIEFAIGGTGEPRIVRCKVVPVSQQKTQKKISKKKVPLQQKETKKIATRQLESVQQVKSRWYKCLKSGLISCTKDFHGIGAIDIPIAGKINIAKDLAAMALSFALVRKFGKEGVALPMAIWLAANLTTRGLKGGIRAGLGKLPWLGSSKLVGKAGTLIGQYAPAIQKSQYVNKAVQLFSTMAVSQVLSPVYYSVLSKMPGYSSIQKKPRQMTEEEKREKEQEAEALRFLESFSKK